MSKSVRNTENGSGNRQRTIEDVVSRLPARRHLERLFVRERGRTVALAIDGIERIEAEQNYVRLCGRDGEHLHRSTITALVAALDPDVFVRISRSTVVRLDAISELRRCGHGDYEILLRSGARVRWSRRYRSRGFGPSIRRSTTFAPGGVLLTNAEGGTFDS
jgi:two-component system LytT family response regulator